MKTCSAFFVALMVGQSILPAAPAFGQGALTPPGAPAAAMKSLAQVEARTIVNATNTPGDASNTFIISAAGSYYLTGNLTGLAGRHGISIQADDVTLDLNGFALTSGGGGAFRGIDVPIARKNLCLRNGTVRGWTDGGVRADVITTSMLAERLRLLDNVGAVGMTMGAGSARDCVASGNATGFFLANGAEIRDCAATGNVTGFIAGDRTMISNCIATVNTGDGFNATSYVSIIDCTSSRNFGHGFVVLANSSVVRCNAGRNTPSGNGIQTGVGCTVADCTVGNNGVNGIKVDFGSTVRNCVSQVNGTNGIFATASCQLIGNACDSNPTGFLLTGNDNRVDGNHCTVKDSTADWKCFELQGVQNVIVRNTARGALRPVPGAPGLFDVNAYTFNRNANAYGPILGTVDGDLSATSAWSNFQNH